MGLTTIISNAAGAAIRGSVSAIDAEQGRIVFTNHGTVIGEISGASEAAADDVVVNRGVIKGPIFLAAGNDLFDGRKGSAVVVHGGDGDDRLTGGGAGNDSLDGGFGNDTSWRRTGTGPVRLPVGSRRHAQCRPDRAISP